MKSSNLTMMLEVDQSPEEAFKAINNVRGWWSESLEGNSEKLNDEFIYRYEDLHYSKQKLIEVVPDKKVVWLVTDSFLSFLKNKEEWTDTQISFEISNKNNKTMILFTHHGLTPEVECFDACTKGWSYYVEESLFNLITTGKGRPNWKAGKANSKTESVN